MLNWDGNSLNMVLRTQRAQIRVIVFSTLLYTYTNMQIHYNIPCGAKNGVPHPLWAMHVTGTAGQAMDFEKQWNQTAGVRKGHRLG